MDMRDCCRVFRIRKDLILPGPASALLGSLLLCATLGCRQTQYENLSTSVQAGRDGGAAPAKFGSPRIADEADSKNSVTPASAQVDVPNSGPAQVLSLQEAIETAFRRQPRLRVFMESVEQARR